MAQVVKHLPTTRVQSLGQEDPQEKEMATHSSTLAWKILRTEGLVGYSPWGRKESDTSEHLHFRPHPRSSHLNHLKISIFILVRSPGDCIHSEVWKALE